MKTLLPHAMKIRFLIGVALCFMQSAIVNAQVLDTRFRAPAVTARTYFEDVVELSDRKLIVVMNGESDSYYYGSTKLQSNLVKLSSAGLLDNTFKTDFYGHAERVFEHKTGSIFVIDRWSDDRLILLSRSGRITKYFDIYGVTSVCVLPDYSFLVSTYDGLVKFKANLEIDTNFGENGSVGVDGDVNDIEYFGGKFYIAGSFGWVGGTYINDVARLNANGSVDTSFNPGGGTGNEIGSITIQPDGKILLGNTYIEDFDGEWFNGYLVRLDTDGSIDWDFETSYFGSVGNIHYASGKIYVTRDEWIWRQLHRLNLDGSHDEDFIPLEFATWGGGFNSFKTKSNEFIMINTFSEGDLEFGLRKYTARGTRVSTFKPALTEGGQIYAMGSFGSKVYIAGWFQWVNGVPRSGVARLNSTGANDATFNFKGQIFQLDNMVVLSDGSVIGRANNWNQIVKIKPNGSWDEQFNFEPGTGSYYYHDAIQELHVTPNDNIVFKAYYGDWHTSLGFGVRNSNGGLVDGFEEDMVTDIYSYSYDTWAHDIAVQSDGKIIYASPATTFNGMGGYERVVRFNVDGSRDETFSVGTAYPVGHQCVTQLTLLNDGGVFLEGSFGTFSGYNFNGHVKLAPSGSIDWNAMNNLANIGFYNDYGYLDYKTTAFRNGFVKYSYTNWYGWDVQMINHDGTPAGRISAEGLGFQWHSDIYESDDRTVFVFSPTWINGVEKSLAKVNYPKLIPLEASPSPARVAQNATYEVFPNPTADFIAFDTDKLARVSIVTMDGDVKVERTVKNAKDQIDVRNLQPGRYVIKMIVDGKVSTSHFVKK